MFAVSRIFQNRMFSLPQEASLVGSSGLNLICLMSNSEVYFATTSGFSPRETRAMSQMIMTSRLCSIFTSFLTSVLNISTPALTR